MADNFRGDNARLCVCIDALLELDASGSLVPHGVGGHARTMLEAAASRLRAIPAPLEPVESDLLPPVGAKVLIHLNSQDAWVEHTVTGYYVWGALSHQIKPGEANAHRVFVRVVDKDGFDNARLLADVRRV